MEQILGVRGRSRGQGIRTAQTINSKTQNLKTAIITGIGGQDGAYLAQKLLSEGYKVIGTTRSISTFDNFRLRYLGIADQIILTRLNEINISSAKDLISQYHPTEIYNLAAQSSVAHSFKDPFETIQYNVLSVMSWLQAIMDTAPETRFYQASSSEMFGNIASEKLPLTENVIFHPASPYGISKATAHWLVVNYREAHGLFGANGILFNHESPLRGQGYVIKKVLSHLVAIHRGKKSEPIKMGNLAIKRDWGYAPAYVAAMHKILQQAASDDYLICSGNVMSLDTFISKSCEKLQVDKQRYILSDPLLFRPNELLEIYGDPAKAKNKLQWNYQITNDELIQLLIREEIKFQEWQESKNHNKEI